MDLSKVKKIYFVGIGGIGMSAVAGIAKAKGFDVSGSDSAEIYDPSKSVLEHHKIPYAIGYSPANLNQPDLVITMAGLDEANPEVAAVLEKGIPIASYAELLGELVKEKKRIVVVGTHGKGTTSGLIAYALKNLEDAGFFVGAVLTDLGTNHHYGSGQYFVIEGDEYKANFNDNLPKFAYYNPDILLINNIEFDHPDIYPDLDAFKKPFRELVRNLKPDATIVYNFDDQNVLDVVGDAKCRKVKFSIEGAEFAEDPKNDVRFESFKLPGKAYACDYAAAITTLREAGYDYAQTKPFVEKYSGVKRRYEIVLDKEVTIIDDYAHHPGAVKATLDASRDKFGDRRIVCFFEPHTYSRTKETLADLAQAFGSADQVFIAEVYPAREQKLPTSITGQEVVEAVRKKHPNVEYVANKADALRKYKQIAQKGDVIIVMAVGSFNTLVNDLQKLS